MNLHIFLERTKLLQINYLLLGLTKSSVFDETFDLNFRTILRIHPKTFEYKNEITLQNKIFPFNSNEFFPLVNLILILLLKNISFSSYSQVNCLIFSNYYDSNKDLMCSDNLDLCSL